MASTTTRYFAGPWWKRQDFRRTGILWLILTPIIGYFCSEIQVSAMGAPASEVMATTERLMRIFTWAASPVAGFVAAMAIVSLLGKRHHGNTPPPDSEDVIETSPKSIAVWMVSSALLCLFALVVGMVALQKDNASLLDPKAIQVDVTGQQWVWNFDYPGGGGVRSQVLHLPVNQPVVFHVTSKDVKHSFWIVQMGIKIDANPGESTETSVTPNKIGTFDIRCAELCGLLHAYMQNKVIVQSQQDYDAWLASQPNSTVSTWTKPGAAA